ncbi:cytosine permease [Enemella dayhoffiae]|uniref:cytosine permease n=1 Tax=Enemella dayhoffiae TaxID=2016507 RepID=UPI001E64F133|nr:cytosine permease [Enemella dayhoffiae]
MDIPALYDPAGRYRGWQWGTIAVYAFGVLIQIPFMAQKLYTGPITKLLSGVDISWIVGLVVTAPPSTTPSPSARCSSPAG